MWQLVGQLVHYIYSDKNLVPFDCQKRHQLINCLKLWERIITKPLVTYSFLKFLAKPIILLYWFAAQYQYPETSIFWHKNETLFTLSLVQNWTRLLPGFRNNCKFDTINQRLKKLRRALFRVWGLTSYYKSLAGRTNCECYVSKK